MRVSILTLGSSIFFSGSLAAKNADPYSAFANPDNHWNPGTIITFANETGFANATERYNSLNAPTFSIAITPATSEDTAKAVSIAKSIDFPFLANGGGHSSSITLAALHNGLAIDLSSLDEVTVDSEAATVTVGGGTVFSQIYDPIFRAGYQLPTGSCACPGMVGVTVGGGVGRYQGLNGLLADALLSARLVTADGELITVSEDSYPDLFWAIRGAGANFGIITSATYRLFPLTNSGMVFNADIILPASSNASYFDALQALENDMPAELATITILTYNPTSAQPEIVVNWVYIGPEEEGQKYIEPILQLNPISVSTSMVAWNRLINTAIGGLGFSICAPVHQNGYGVSMRNLSSSTYQEVFQTLSDLYVDFPDAAASSVEIEIFAPQAVEKVPNDGTAYPWRDTRAYVGISSGGADEETQQAGAEAAFNIRSAFAETSGYDGLAVYVSYAHGDETLEEMYGSNLPRLLELKKKWDPKNLFRFFQNLR
ncbi:Glucooligosaccharide oxidase [Xylariaceae sp. FL1272]|nr:Glucooligosaccharide oxidase [Xylariaceae sp. FL1272]